MTHSDNSGDAGEQEQKRYFYHTDHLGSAQFITDWNGDRYEHIEYTPYGELWVEETAAGLDSLPFRFTGKEYDDETGLYYYGARYLDPKYSRWLSSDPAMGEYIPQAPINDEAKKKNQNLLGQGGVFNTVNLHLYHYAGNNPVKYVDPDGRTIYYVGASYNMSSYKKNNLGNSKEETISTAGCYITTFANIAITAMTLYGRKVVENSSYSGPIGINNDKTLFAKDSGNLNGRTSSMNAIFGKGNWDYWTKAVQGENGLLSKLKDYDSSKSGYMIIGIFDLSKATDKVTNHMVAIRGLPDKDGVFNYITPTSNGDRNRLLDSTKRKEYAMKNLKEIRIIKVDD